MSTSGNFYDVVIFAPTPVGGLAEHVHYQADALHRAGISVIVLCNSQFLSGRAKLYPTEHIFAVPSKTKSSMGKLSRLGANIRCYKRLYEWFLEHPCRILLLETYSEYFAPLWSQYLKNIRVSGVRIVANLHDPVRDFLLGPKWWHDWSVSLAYRDISDALCHQELPPEANLPPHVVVHTVPVGVYQPLAIELDRIEARRVIDAPQDKRIFLSFGYIRDNKNLDLFIRAMSAAPNVFLIVAGRPQSGKDRSCEEYLNIAAACGVADRVRFDTGFIPDERIPYYFASSDVILLTYSSSFHSQSGVLNVAAGYRKPVLASSGKSPLQDAVVKYGLGKFIPPDCESAVGVALQEGLDGSAADWDGYFRYASWETNVHPIMKILKTDHHARKVL